ncbi:MAG: hypothetical protein ABFR97_09265 [Thermodesulfobacteriota bacterium]
MKNVRKMFVVFSVSFCLVALTSGAQAFDFDDFFNYHDSNKVDISDIFTRSLEPIDLASDEIQFFVDRLPYGSQVFAQTGPDGTRTFTFLSYSEFGCIAKILPAVPGVKPQLYMHIINCQMDRVRKSGEAVTNYIHHIIEKADGTVVKEFSSTATWAFNHVTDMVVETATGMQFDDIWLVETHVVNDFGPSMIQYYTVEDIGIVGKRKALVSW